MSREETSGRALGHSGVGLVCTNPFYVNTKAHYIRCTHQTNSHYLASVPMGWPHHRLFENTGNGPRTCEFGPVDSYQTGPQFVQNIQVQGFLNSFSCIDLRMVFIPPTFPLPQPSNNLEADVLAQLQDDPVYPFILPFQVPPFPSRNIDTSIFHWPSHFTSPFPFFPSLPFLRFLPFIPPILT